MEFKEAVKIVDNILSKHSFKKKRYAFTRELGDFVQIIDVQKSSFSEEFTINIGFIHLHAFRSVFKKEPSYSTAEGVLVFRIGELLNDFKPKAFDKWWLLDDEQAIRLEVESILTEKVVPFMDMMLTERQIIEFMETYKHVNILTSAIRAQIEVIKQRMVSG